MKSSSRILFGLLMGLTGVVFWCTVAGGIVRTSFERDYLNLYTGGYLARTGQMAKLYDFDVQKAAQDRLVPGLPVHFPFVRPPFHALMLAPISLLDVRTAYPVWLALQVAAMIGLWAWAWRRFGAESMVYCSFFLPIPMGIAHGQDCMVLALELLAAWLLIERKRDFAAGLVLSLTLAKFHLLLLLPLAILLRRRWRLAGGYALGGTALAGVSLALVGVAGIRDYVALLTRKDLETLAPSRELMIGFGAIGENLLPDLAWLQWVLMAIPPCLVAWSALRSREEVRWFWTAVVGSMLFSPHTYGYDLAGLLIAGLLAVYGQDRPLRVSAAVMLVPIGFFFLLGGRPWAIVPSLVTATFLVLLSGIRRPAHLPASG